MQNAEKTIIDLSALLNPNNTADKYIEELSALYSQYGMSRELLTPLWTKLKLILQYLNDNSSKFTPYHSLTTLLLNGKPLQHDRVSQELLDMTIKHIMNFAIASLIEKNKNPSINLPTRIKGILLEALEELAFSSLDENSRQQKLAFDDKELTELFQLTQTILKLSKQNTQFIFIGRSPLWIYYLMKELKTRHEMFCFPISGAIYSANDAQQKAYIEYLKSKNTIFNKSIPLELIVIDIVDSGKTLDDFYMWVKAIAEESNLAVTLTKFKIHKFGQALSTKPHEYNAAISGTLFEKITSKHRCYAEYTPGQVFYPAAWPNWKFLEFDITHPPINDHAKPRIVQLQQFVYNHFNKLEQSNIAYRS